MPLTKPKFLSISLIFFLFHLNARAIDSQALSQRASHLFLRLAGVPLALTDPRRTQMDLFIAQGRDEDAAHIATGDPNFYNATVKSWAMVMSNLDRDAFGTFN